MQKNNYYSPDLNGNVVGLAYTEEMDKKGLCISREFNFNAGKITKVLLHVETKKALSKPEVTAIDPLIIEACKFMSGEEVQGWKTRKDGTLVKRDYTKEMDENGVYLSKRFDFARGTISEAVVSKAESGKKEVIYPSTVSHIDHILIDACREVVKLKKSQKPKA